MNVLWAAIFAFVARLRSRRCAAALTRSLNIQLTYTLLLAIPFVLGDGLNRWPAAKQIFAPGSQAALLAGVGLGLLGALSVLSLVFFNTRAFTESLFGREHSAIPHLRFLREPAEKDRDSE